MPISGMPLVFPSLPMPQVMTRVESVRSVTSTYTLAATGDAIEGTVERYIEGEEMPMSGPQPFGGKRAK